MPTVLLLGQTWVIRPPQRCANDAVVVRSYLDIPECACAIGSWFYSLECEISCELSSGRNWRDESDLVESIIDRHRFIDQEDVVGHCNDERQNKEAVGNGMTILALSSFDVGMDPLPVPGGIRERVNHDLVNFNEFAWS